MFNGIAAVQVDADVDVVADRLPQLPQVLHDLVEVGARLDEADRGLR
jgi:hypothetical protein